MIAMLHEILKWLSDNNLSREGLYIFGALAGVYLVTRGGNGLGKWLGRKHKDDKSSSS